MKHLVWRDPHSGLPSVSPKIALNIEVLVVDHWSFEEGQGHLDPRFPRKFHV